jgi:hypothetical protein
MPIFKFVAMYSPAASVLTVVEVAVSTWVTVTATSGRDDPEESETTPAIRPVVT